MTGCLPRVLGVMTAGMGLAAAGVWLAIALSPDRDPHRAIARRASRVATVERASAPELGRRVERWRIVTAAGDTLSALWRGAPPGVSRAWTVVLLGGIGTDDRAALVVPAETPANVLAMRWPWRGPKRMGVARFLAAIPAIREALLRAPGVLAAGAEAAARAPEADAGRIALLGASLGSAPAIAAARLVPDSVAILVLDGGADLRHLLRHELGRQRVNARVAGPAARFAAWLVGPLEPRRHAEALRGHRVLFLNARRDERLPEGSAGRLHALFPGARVVWRDAPHVRPGQVEEIAGIAARAVEWLEEAPRPRR